MKFSRLIERTEEYADRVRQGRRIKPEKLAELQGLLIDKIARYEARLGDDITELKRDKLETRLKVVRAQLHKSEQLATTS